ncbi:hypothetical protein BS50DRAFT_217244 [Corynespora cassiicola Philippines]|uniref:Zn(2)-C6 fungal-type domain-containing protein n=1 Tax=Corynespora cassiicola Philippines TaxID=1448308 RepID=A0A2T2N423_CORCC|nr:hypothetical protein BS50DRAFT_217244 [Corynespora cassiicola Philippines]
MAELVGLATSITQIAGAGAKLSTDLYSSLDPAVAGGNHEVEAVAAHVEVTAKALHGIASIFRDDHAPSFVSERATQDASNLIQQCESVFSDVYEVVDKRRKASKDGTAGLGALGKMAWPLMDQRIELLRRRLENLKNSLILLVHVLQLARSQAKGNLEKSDLHEVREKIRELHQRQQESLKSLQALETKLSKLNFDDDDSVQGSSPSTRVPTIDFLTSPSLPSYSIQAKMDANFKSTPSAERDPPTDDSDSSDSDEIMSDDEEHMALDEISKCARHVQKLLNQINVLQRSPSDRQDSRRRIRKLYRRFCRRFESDLATSGTKSTPDSLPLPAFAPPPRVLRPAPTITIAPQKQGSMETETSPDPSEISRPEDPSGHSRKSSITVSNQNSPLARDKMESPLMANVDPSQQSQSPLGPNSGSPKDAPLQYTKTGRISKAKKGLKVHSCECGRSYTRAEHLRRHQKNHEQTAFTCTFAHCGKTFFRLDLLQRHQERHQDRLANNLPDFSPRPNAVRDQNITRSPQSTSAPFGGHKPTLGVPLQVPSYGQGEPLIARPVAGNPYGLGEDHQHVIPPLTGPTSTPNQRPLLPSIDKFAAGASQDSHREANSHDRGVLVTHLRCPSCNRMGTLVSYKGPKETTLLCNTCNYKHISVEEERRTEHHRPTPTSTTRSGESSLEEYNSGELTVVCGNENRKAMYPANEQPAPVQGSAVPVQQHSPTKSASGKDVEMDMGEYDTMTAEEKANSCVQCKSRHIKCDGGVQCSRCRAEGVDCMYMKPFLSWQTEKKEEPRDPMRRSTSDGLPHSASPDRNNTTIPTWHKPHPQHHAPSTEAIPRSAPSHISTQPESSSDRAEDHPHHPHHSNPSISNGNTRDAAPAEPYTDKRKAQHASPSDQLENGDPQRANVSPEATNRSPRQTVPRPEDAQNPKRRRISRANDTTPPARAGEDGEARAGDVEGGKKDIVDFLLGEWGAGKN